MDERQAQTQLSLLVAEAIAALDKATEFADEHKLEFHFSPTYGMGGWYGPDDEDDGSNRWYPSSQSC